jgi:hypothetical protein
MAEELRAFALRYGPDVLTLEYYSSTTTINLHLRGRVKNNRGVERQIFCFTLLIPALARLCVLAHFSRSVLYT